MATLTADRARVRGAVRPVAPALATALAAQNARYAASPARDEHVAALASGAAAVVTGQQAGLFLGPLFTLYKAATAVRLARTLAAESGVPVVPVFWLQTEDHDLAEIAHVEVAPSRGVALRLALPAGDDRVPIAARTLPPEVESCLTALRDDLSYLPHAGEHVDRLARHYRPGAGWGEAFAGVLAELFAPHGLVLLDPRDPALAELARPVHEKALDAAGPIAEALAARVGALAAQGTTAGVHVREGSPLFFYQPDGPDGPRFRLAAAPGGFAEIGGTRTHGEAELRAGLAERPGAFSTSALLRPILQDTWLPTAAYVGGPAEVAYFEQIAPLYGIFGLPMPLVVPRARIAVLEEKTRKVLARLKLDAVEAAGAEDDVLALVRERSGGGASAAAPIRRVLDSLDEALGEIAPALREAGDGIDDAIEKTRATVARAVGKLGEKYDRGLAHRDQSVVDDVRRLRTWLAPGGVPQERVYGMSYFAARHGDLAFVERVVAVAEPFDGRVRELTP